MATNPRHSAEYFSRWYEQNAEALNAKRRERYHTDPEYKAKQLENRRKQLERGRSLSPLNPTYTKTFSEAAEELGISIWRLRNWRNNNYFPEPYPYGKFLYFTDRQVELLRGLTNFIGDKPRLSAEDRAKMEDITNLIFANWQG